MKSGGCGKMLIKSYNHKYMIKVDKYNNDNCDIIVYRIDECKINEMSRKKIKCSLGNNRMAISIDGRYVVSALYEKVLFIYEVEYEKPVCIKKMRKNIDVVFADASNIYCVFINGEVEVLNFKGETLEKNKKIEYIKVSQYGELYLNNYCNFKISNKIIYPNTTKFINAVATKSGVALTEIRGKIMFISESGYKKWEYENEIDSHYIKLAYLENKDVVIAISVNYVNKNEKIKIHFINCQGNALYICEIERLEYEFCLGISYLLDCNMKLYDLNKICENSDKCSYMNI